MEILTAGTFSAFRNLQSARKDITLTGDSPETDFGMTPRTTHLRNSRTGASYNIINQGAEAMKKKSKPIIIAVVILLAAAAGGAAVYFDQESNKSGLEKAASKTADWGEKTAGKTKSLFQ